MGSKIVGYEWATEQQQQLGLLLLFFQGAAAAAAKSLQLCPTLCDPTDRSPPGSSVCGILQARTLEWVAISFSNAGKWKVKVKSLSHAQLVVTPWLQPTRLLRPWGFLGKSTGMGCHCLLGSKKQASFNFRATVILEPKKIKAVPAFMFSLLFALKWWNRRPWSSSLNVEF